MPGIAGILGGLGEHLNRAAEAMLAAMPQDRGLRSGTYVNSQARAGIAWTCHSGSFADCMPAWNETRDICLFVAGEHFSGNGPSRATQNGERQGPQHTAASLVGLYEERGPAFLRELNGPCSGLLLDLRQKKALLFNDRFGLRRIYAHEHQGALYFASEAKCLLKVLPHLRRLDPQGLGEFFSCGCVLQNRTLFPEVSLLPPASVWTWETGGSFSRSVYFDPGEWESLPVLSAAEFPERLRQTFARILPRYFQGTSPLALSLTGGLDSRMVLAWAPRTPYKLRCFTFGGLYRECSDVVIARKVARVAQQHHEVVPLNKKFFAEFPALAKRSVVFSDGAMDVTGAVELFMNRAAREIAPVRLTGNYGDEVLRGHVAFRPNPVGLECLSPELVSWTARAAEVYAAEQAVRRPTFILFKQVPWHHYARFAVEQTQLTTRAPFLDNEIAALAYQAPPELAESPEVALDAIAQGNPRLARVPTDRGFSWRPNPVLSRLRQAGQYLTIRAEYAWDYGMPQWLSRADKSLSRLELDRWFLGRHKFCHFRRWYRDELSKYVRDVLLDSRSLNRPYVNAAGVRRIVEAHTSGVENHTLAIHKLLTAELICRNLLEVKE